MNLPCELARFIWSKTLPNYNASYGKKSLQHVSIDNTLAETKKTWINDFWRQLAVWALRTAHVQLFTTVQVWSSVQHINNPHKLRHFWKNPVKLWKSRKEIWIFAAKQKPSLCFSTGFYPRWIPAHNQLVITFLPGHNHTVCQSSSPDFHSFCQCVENKIVISFIAANKSFPG